MNYDDVYKGLFSHKRIVTELITFFSIPNLADILDLTTLELLDTQYKLRKGDRAWKVKYKHHNEYFYLLILLEFQSEIDETMPIRILTYTGELYQKQVTKYGLNLKEHKLPDVLPIVIYNGALQWTAKTDLASLRIEKTNEIEKQLEIYQPNQSYFLIDLSQYIGINDHDNVILNPLFAVESDVLIQEKIDMDHYFTAFEALLERLKLDETLVFQLKTFFQMIFDRKLTYLNEKLAKKQEKKSMGVLENIDKVIKKETEKAKIKARAEGLEEGRQVGRQEGRQEGRQVGLQEGLQQGEHDAKIQMAKQLLQLGLLDIDKIQQVTGLSLEELNQLKNH